MRKESVAGHRARKVPGMLRRYAVSRNRVCPECRFQGSVGKRMVMVRKGRQGAESECHATLLALI